MFPSSISLGRTFAEAQLGLAAFGWPTWQKMKKRVFEGKTWLGLFFWKAITECHRRLSFIIPWNSNRNASIHGRVSYCHREYLPRWGSHYDQPCWEQDEEFEEQRMLLDASYARCICPAYLQPPAEQTCGVFEQATMPWQLARFVLLLWIRTQFICFSKIVICFPRPLFLPIHIGARQERNASQGCSIESFSEHISQDTIFPVNCPRVHCCHGEVLRKTGRASQVLF